MNELHFISMQCAYKRAYVKGKYNFKARWGGGKFIHPPPRPLYNVNIFIVLIRFAFEL